MKKGCLIVLAILAVLLLALVVSLFIAYRVADTQFGLRLAPPITHEHLATGTTRIRLAVYPEKMANTLAAYIPSDVEIPTGPFTLESLLRRFLPREIALLARTDVLGKKIYLTAFANEKYLGRAVKEAVNASEFFSQVRQVTWTSAGFELPERGLLFAEGNLSIPDAVEEEILELWPMKTAAPPAPIQGNSHVELVIDNRDGDILALAAALVQANGQNWELLRAHEYGTMAVGIIESIFVARLTADLVNTDMAQIHLRIDSDDAKGPGLQFLLSGLALPYLRDYLKNEHNLILEGELPWVATEKAIIGEFKLTGLAEFIGSKIQVN